jgi:hypothetical protein
MSSLQHTDTPLAAHAPSLAPTKPPLPFVRAPRGRFAARPGQDDAADATRERRVFILGRREASITGGQIWWAPKYRDVAVEGRRPERHVRRSRRMDLVRGDDLMLGLLNRHEFAEFSRPGDLALPNGLGMWLKDAEDFIGHVGIAPEHACASLVENPVHQRVHGLELLARLGQDRCDRGWRGADPLADAADHGRGIAYDRARGRHQPPITAHQRVACLRTPRLPAND